MNILNEFLESTTIHGLYYISTCKSHIAKAGWLVVVALGFVASIILIHSSFSEWAKSPVATTITPHPVADLPFPNITICPPKGLNGALKYDLMRLAKMSLSAEKTEELIQIAALVFNEEGGNMFLKMIGEENIENYYEGFQKVTEERDNITVEMSNVNGTFVSPFYGEKMTSQLCRQLAGKTVKLKLETEDIKKMLGDDGTLKIEVYMDTEVEEEVKVKKTNHHNFRGDAHLLLPGEPQRQVPVLPRPASLGASGEVLCWKGRPSGVNSLASTTERTHRGSTGRRL